MKGTSSKIWSTYLLILCISTLVYIEPILEKSDNLTSPLESLNLDDLTDFTDFEDYINDNPVKKLNIPGNFKTKAFFSYNQLVSALDADGDALEWWEFDADNQNGGSIINSRYAVGDHPNILYSYPTADDTYTLLKDVMNQAAARKSIMFTPEMTNDATISGKIHYLINIHRDSNAGFPDYDSIDITLKVTLLHFFNGNSSTKEINSIEHLLDTVAPSTEYIQNVTLNSTISEYTIPAGDRLKVKYEIKYSDIAAEYGHVTLQSLADEGWIGYYPDNKVNWDIIDGIYSKSYELSDVDAVFGFQLYMREEIYPDVQIFNVDEGSVYQTAELINIDVTDGSDSYYRWDTASWIPFIDDKTTTIPTTHGWHTLDVSASEPIYNNTVIKNRTVGYDASYDNLQLHNAISGEKLPGGFVLNFSAYNVTSVSYAWDGSPTPISLLSPYDITTSMYNGLHNITVNATDYYKTRTYNYQFYFDSDAPLINLSNVVNDTFLLAGKTINIQITDYSDFNFLNYSWISVQNWLYDASDIYSTEMPIGDGYHWLMVYTEDEFGHLNTTNYRFYTSSTVFSVDLKYWDNESYHQGGEDVELIIQQSNTTLYYSWNGGSETQASVGTSLVLTGANALPSAEGLQNVTIRIFNLTDHEHIYYFNFIVDQTAPQFTDTYSIYNNTRLLSSVEFQFYVNDTYTSTNSLIVQYSLNGMIYESFDTRFLFPLSFYSDGDYSLEVYAEDKAGNTASFKIYFTIDTTDPTILSVTIPDLVDDSIHGNLFVPENALVQVLASDADPRIRFFYKWNAGPKIEFIDDFILISAIDKNAKLTIYVNDTLGNEAKYDINLVYDSTPPVVVLEWPSPLAKINDRTWLEFNAQDYSQFSLLSVEYEWDYGGIVIANPETDGFFDFQMNPLTLLGYHTFVYLIYGYAIANLTITVEDILGHTDNYYFSFEIDQYAPELGLHYFNGQDYVAMNADGYYPDVPGGSELWYDSSLNDDLAYFKYYFDDDDEPTYLNDPWNFTLPTEDGNHTLQVILADTTGENLTQNVLIANFTFLIDDIAIYVIDPLDLSHADDISMIYNETFRYTVNVTDSVDNETIDGLQYFLSYDVETNLNITVIQIDNSTFEIILHATNVTDGVGTDVTIRFYNKNPDGGELFTLTFTIDKKDADLTITDSSDISVEYGELFQIYVTLQENTTFLYQTINNLKVNGTEIAKEDFYFNETTFVCMFNYPSTIIGTKGNFSLIILAESLYYYGVTNLTSLHEIEIRPIPVLIDVWVSNSTILEGTSLTIFANLSTIYGDPVVGVEIFFYVYIYYKTNATETNNQPKLLIIGFNDTHSDSDNTNAEGIASVAYTLESNVDYVRIMVDYDGSGILDEIQFEYEDIIITIPPPEAAKLPTWILALIIGGSILIAGIISFIIYKATRPKPFEDLMKKVTDEEIALNYSILSPGIMLSIFDQRKGPIPLVTDHSLSIGRYIGRMQIGIENFLLKIADQAYSSLGFEEHTDERRVGSIVLPSEKMVGFLQGIQLKNAQARGGFENLSLIVLADREYGNLLLNYQEYLYPKIDELDAALKEKDSLKKVEETIKEIRKISVIIVLAAQKVEKAQENGNSS